MQKTKHNVSRKVSKSYSKGRKGTLAQTQWGSVTSNGLDPLGSSDGSRFPPHDPRNSCNPRNTYCFAASPLPPQTRFTLDVLQLCPSKAPLANWCSCGPTWDKWHNMVNGRGTMMQFLQKTISIVHRWKKSRLSIDQDHSSPGAIL